MNIITAIDKPDYQVKFHMKDFDGGWKVDKTFNDKVVETRYCLNADHARRTMMWELNKCWGFRLN